MEHGAWVGTSRTPRSGRASSQTLPISDDEVDVVVFLGQQLVAQHVGVVPVHMSKMTDAGGALPCITAGGTASLPMEPPPPVTSTVSPAM